MKLWNKHGTQPRYARMPEDFDTVVSNGGALAGSPATIRDHVKSMADAAGASYFIAQFPSVICHIRRCFTPRASSPASCSPRRGNARHQRFE